MGQYILKRMLLIVPTLLGILITNFVIIQAAPGGPVEQLIAQITGTGVEATARFSGSSQSEVSQQAPKHNVAHGAVSKYRGAQGLDPELIQQIEAYYGFDQPAYVRFWQMLKNYALFDFGDSFFKDQSVVSLILEKMPVSISLGLWSTLLIYLISIPLGIRKAVKDGTPFDFWSSTAITLGVAIPNFLFAILLIILFAGGIYWQIFPLRGITSAHWEELSLIGKVFDYFWHMALPITAMVIGGFASLTFLCKNSFLEEMHKQYVMTARAKGLSEKQVLYRHVFRNALLIVIAGFPGAFIAIFFTGSLLIETIFSLDGLGLLGFEALVKRDYPVIFGTLYIYSLIGLIFYIIGDIMYVIIDPRIDFESRET